MKEQINYVVKNSKYVSINKENINSFIDCLGIINYKHWSKSLELNISEEEWVLLVFIIESINFCFWPNPKWTIKYNNKIEKGSNALLFSIIKEVQKKPDFLNINYLNNLTEDNFIAIFGLSEGEDPLLKKRYSNFKEIITCFYNNKNFYKEIYSIKTDKLLLNYIIKNFPCFDDKSKYKGRIIHFNKRANLLVNDLFYVSKKIRTNLGNVNNLIGCADYSIPRIFRDYNILEYSNELKCLIDNKKEILHDSEMEIEIRANMLYVIEIIKEKLNARNVLINSIELDNLIWIIAKNNKNNKSVVHHTITSFY